VRPFGDRETGAMGLVLRRRCDMWMRVRTVTASELFRLSLGCREDKKLPIEDDNFLVGRFSIWRRSKSAK
jgi:hypothetical protein